MTNLFPRRPTPMNADLNENHNQSDVCCLIHSDIAGHQSSYLRRSAQSAGILGFTQVALHS